MSNVWTDTGFGNPKAVPWEPHPDDRAALGLRLEEQFNIHPSEDCSTCHR